MHGWYRSQQSAMSRAYTTLTMRAPTFRLAAQAVPKLIARADAKLGQAIVRGLWKAEDVVTALSSYAQATVGVLAVRWVAWASEHKGTAEYVKGAVSWVLGQLGLPTTGTPPLGGPKTH
jgi:hypothetical protein